MGYAVWQSDCEEGKIENKSTPKKRNIGEHRIGTAFGENGKKLLMRRMVKKIIKIGY